VIWAPPATSTFQPSSALSVTLPEQDNKTTLAAMPPNSDIARFFNDL
jgi:hypothetical protein